MFAITGITGKVGGEMARALLGAGQKVRAVVRDTAKAQEWADLGCEIAIAAMEDEAALTAAFMGAEAVFILPPPKFDPLPGFPEIRAEIARLAAALKAARPGRVLCLSTIGADAPHETLLSPRGWLEEALKELDLPLTVLRPGWFIDNAAWDVASVRETGVLQSFLRPVDKAFPMVAAQDVGRRAASLIQERWVGFRLVELEGPVRVSPQDLADAFAKALGRDVRVAAVPRAGWEALFRAQGMQNPLPRIRMLDGFNEGWIEFADGGAEKGQTSANEVVAALVATA